ncbi:MAG: hypothetical protein OQJ77_03775, partial [Thiovulaceae bacterium]|nr:hypothetical protein [Sulfurimonadaceae bacterium]
MKRNNIILLLSLLTFITSVNAADVEKTKDTVETIHSVRQTIDEGSKVEQKEPSVVDAFKGIFSDAKVVGQIRSISAGYNNKEMGVNDTYATAIGGALKYELASLNGFNAAFGVLVSNDIDWATGESQKHNDELSSSNTEYITTSEAYINYKNKGFNFRAGRQLIDTPLADSDDIRMIANTFEGYTLTYDISDFTFYAAKYGKWQGVDAGLDNGWQKLCQHGVNIGGISYTNSQKYLNAWYYNMTGLTNAVYLDGGLDFDISKELYIHVDAQYLIEKEIDNSGVSATIYGAYIGAFIDKFGINLGYNKAHEHKNKESFSGVGGGSLYSSMDTMIIDEIAKDRDAEAVVMGITYALDKLKFLYAIGSFTGSKNSSGIKENIQEQDMGFEYNYDEDFSLTGLYV